MNARSKASVGLVALLSINSNAAPRTTQVLAMRLYGTRPAVEVSVNGQGPFLFLVDTGAGGPPARADVSLLKRLSLIRTGTTTASDAGAAAASIDHVTLQSVKLGNWTRANVEALARDYNGSTYLPHLDGILGFGFFKEGLLTLDYVHHRVILSRGALPPPDGRTILPYRLVEGNPAIRVMLGGQAKTMLVDTGDIRAVDIPSSWLQAMPLASFPRVAGTSSSISGTTPIREVALALPLVIGAYRIERPLVTFSEEFEVGNLGSTALRDFIITFDQSHHRIQLKRMR